MSDSPIYFYGGPFSNFVGYPIALPNQWGKETTYLTVEHYFQAQKATTQSEHDYVNEAKSPSEAKRRGQNIRLRWDWDDVRYRIMLRGLWVKFCNPEYRGYLLDTGDRELREDSPTDFIWGCRNDGQNLLGKALMEVRAKINDKT